jgi:hypothetical protein
MQKSDAPHSSASSTDASDEKARMAQIEHAGAADREMGEVDTSGIDERKLIRKLDMALIPWLSFLYLLSFLDRTSIGNAKVRYPTTVLRFALIVYLLQLYGLEKDLKISDPQYNIALMIFFFSYSLFEVRHVRLLRESLKDSHSLRRFLLTFSSRDYDLLYGFPF